MKADPNDRASLWKLRCLSEKSEQGNGHFIWLQDDKIKVGIPEGDNNDLWKITEFNDGNPGWYQ